MFGIRVDTNNFSIEPAFTFPEFGCKKDAHAVTNLDRIGHGKDLFAAIIPQENGKPDHDRNPSVDSPLHFAGHKASGQDIDSLQEPDCPCQCEHGTEDVEEIFTGFSFFDSKCFDDYTLVARRLFPSRNRLPV